LIRLSVGIEDIDDLKADLQAVIWNTRIINTFNFGTEFNVWKEPVVKQIKKKTIKRVLHIKIFYANNSVSCRVERQKKHI
jgi:hypothetical protein